MDENKWVDNVLCLNESAKKLLLGLHAIKQMFKKSENAEKELIIDNIVFRPIQIQKQKLYDIQELIDASIGTNKKSILKSFPNVGVRSDPHLSCKLKPIYEILCHTVEFLEYSNVCIRQALVFIKLSKFINPQISVDFLLLISFYSSIVYLIALMNSDLKILSLMYIHQTKDEYWTRLVKLLLRCDKPHEYLLQAFECIIPKIVPLIQEYATDVDQMMITAQEMRKSAVLSLIPDLSGVKAPEMDSIFLYNLANSNMIYKNIMIGTLIIPYENLKQTDLLQMLKKLSNFSTSLSIVRSESIDLSNALDSSFASKVKSELSTNYQRLWDFHAERRNYLRYQLRQIYNLCHETQVLTDKFSVVFTALSMAKNEILWYFRNLQMDSKKVNAGIDMNIFDLLNLITSLGNILLKNEHSKHILLISDVIASLKVKLKEPCLVCSNLISNFIETNRLGKSSTGSILQEIWRVLDTITHMGESRTDFKAMAINWRRFQGIVSLSAGLISDADYLEIVPLMTEIVELSNTIDSYQSRIRSISSLRELYYFLPDIKDHAYLVLESLDTDAIRNLECLVMIIDVFSDNASSSWPEEYDMIVSKSSYFALEFYSLIGKVTSYFVDQICKTDVDHALQFLPENAVKFFAMPVPEVGRRKTVKMEVKVPRLRPGWESSLRTNSEIPIQKKLLEWKSCASSLLCAMSKKEALTIMNSIIHPGVFFAESARDKMKSCINNGSISKIDRPSVLSIKIKTYMSSLLRSSSSMGRLCMPFIQEVLQESISPQRTEFFDGKNNGDSYSILAGYLECYSNINDQNLGSIELYIHQTELECLKELLGNPGIDFLKKNWIKQEFMIQMQHFLSVNLESLVRISSDWISDSTWDLIKRLKGMKDMMGLVIQIGFRLMILRQLDDSILLEAKGKSISPSLESFADMPLVFACLILFHISDEKYIIKHAEWIMHCGLYLMMNQTDRISQFISLCTRSMSFSKDKKEFQNEKMYVWSQIFIEHCADPSQPMFSLLLPVTNEQSNFIDETDLSL